MAHVEFDTEKKFVVIIDKGDTPADIVTLPVTGRMSFRPYEEQAKQDGAKSEYKDEPDTGGTSQEKPRRNQKK